MRKTQIALFGILASLSSFAMLASANTSENSTHETITPVQIGVYPQEGWGLMRHAQLMDIAGRLNVIHKNGGSVGPCRITEISAAYVAVPRTFWSNKSFYRLSFVVDAGEGKSLAVKLESKTVGTRFDESYWYKKKYNGADAKFVFDGENAKLIEIANDAGSVQCSNSK